MKRQDFQPPDQNLVLDKYIVTFGKRVREVGWVSDYEFRAADSITAVYKCGRTRALKNRFGAVA